ncbi:hypothetical protein [Hyphococcus sp.]|jgi:hypothetical protein|uniref:hypothetical protein n=1 Tax=Hyphococcus sp. TaxID=2038636 RepID=UPI003D0AD3A0
MPSDGDAGEGMDFVSASAIYLDGKFSVWYLLGEPVINCTARWKNTDQASMEIDPLSDGSRLIERAQPSEIEIYNLLLAASGPDPRDTKYGFGSSKTIAVLCDAGVVAQNGRSGFNVAGSPSWDKFLCALPDAGVRFQGPDSGNKDACLAMNGKWLSAADAKQVALGGLKLSEVTALKASLNGVAVMKRAEKRAWREKSAAFKRARTAAYFADFPAREGEGTAGWTDRKNDAMRRLPLLPEKNPSAEQLKAYEDSWQALIVETAPGGAFTKEWREREKTLVAAQLQRIKALDKAAAKEEARLSSYITALDRKKENEPAEPDPMAAYRTATLTAVQDDQYTCYLKRPDGTIAAELGLRDSVPRCIIKQPDKAYGIYFSDRVYGYGASFAQVVFDNNGEPLLVVQNSPTSANIYFEALDYGVIDTFEHYGAYRGTHSFYSILLRREIFTSGPGYISSATPYLRKGRPALAILRDAALGQCPGSDFMYISDYFYLDTERLEETGICAVPANDPANMKIN